MIGRQKIDIDKSGDIRTNVSSLEYAGGDSGSDESINRAGMSNDDDRHLEIKDDN